MAEQRAIPQIFDSHLRTLRISRAARRMSKGGISFLLTRCLDDVAERMLDVNRRFETVYLIADFDIRAELISRLPTDKQPKAFFFLGSNYNLPKQPKADLILCLLTLHNKDNPPDDIMHMAKHLKEDGMFIAACFGGDTLTELRQSLYKTDDEILGGTTPRIFPMITHSQAAPLLTRAGLNLPVVDMDRFDVKYSRLETLISDLRDIGATNILCNRSSQTLTRAYLARLKSNYQDMFGKTGKLKSSFEILWLTGWAPHPSQQKPLKPGSAKMRLADALKPPPDNPIG